VKIEYVDGQKSMADRLIDGEVDAMITDISDAKLFDILENSSKVRRLFPNYIEEDERLYRETGIFTPVHIIVMSKKLDRQYSDLAGKLYTAFEQAKKMAYEDILSDRAGFSVVYLRERMKEQRQRWGDPWKYGIKANKSTIDALIGYNHEQGMIRSELSYGEIFAEATLES
jgi:4,5-dihydroxyphthalate decarboxylase